MRNEGKSKGTAGAARLRRKQAQQDAADDPRCKAVPGDNKVLYKVEMATHLTVLAGKEEWFANQMKLLSGDVRSVRQIMVFPAVVWP